MLPNSSIGRSASYRDPNIEVRLAAIYVLREAAKDFPDLSNPVFELLQAYLRTGVADYGDGPPPIDVAEIAKILKRQARERVMQIKSEPKKATLDIHGAFVRRVDLSRTSLRSAILDDADATNAIFRGADFAGASLKGTILRGADLSDATNLTLEQLSQAVIDSATILPNYIDRSRLTPR